jgi:thiamine kinase-like enzyme
MHEEIPKQVLKIFTTYSAGLPDHSAGEITVERIGGGLINHSYRISCQHKPSLLLQQINKNVFSNPEDVQENYLAIWQYAEFEFTGLRLPSPKYCGRNVTLFIDENENYWRAFEFIDNANMLLVAKKPSQAKATAKAFAKFTAAFDEFNVQSLKTVIPDFHNLSFRYQQFEESLNTELYERMAKALSLINEIKQRERYKHFYEIIIESGEFLQRVMHHDAKIANILFSKASGKVICPVDFDTVMPGYFFSDLGDIIRSMACSHDENSIEFENLSIRKNFYDAIIEGYLSVMEKQLTDSEKKYIHYAGLLMIYMQALRFLTDYLNGDIYYRIDYTEQNLNRAKNQFILLEKLETFLKAEYSFSV